MAHRPKRGFVHRFEVEAASWDNGYDEEQRELANRHATKVSMKHKDFVAMKEERFRRDKARGFAQPFSPEGAMHLGLSPHKLWKRLQAMSLTDVEIVSIASRYQHMSLLRLMVKDNAEVVERLRNAKSGLKAQGIYLSWVRDLTQCGDVEIQPGPSKHIIAVVYATLLVSAYVIVSRERALRADPVGPINNIVPLAMANIFALPLTFLSPPVYVVTMMALHGSLVQNAGYVNSIASLNHTCHQLVQGLSNVAVELYDYYVGQVESTYVCNVSGCAWLTINEALLLRAGIEPNPGPPKVTRQVDQKKTRRLKKGDQHLCGWRDEKTGKLKPALIAMLATQLRDLKYAICLISIQSLTASEGWRADGPPLCSRCKYDIFTDIQGCSEQWAVEQPVEPVRILEKPVVEKVVVPVPGTSKGKEPADEAPLPKPAVDVPAPKEDVKSVFEELPEITLRDGFRPKLDRLKIFMAELFRGCVVHDLAYTHYAAKDLDQRLLNTHVYKRDMGNVVVGRLLYQYREWLGLWVSWTGLLSGALTLYEAFFGVLKQSEFHFVPHLVSIALSDTSIITNPSVALANARAKLSRTPQLNIPDILHADLAAGSEFVYWFATFDQLNNARVVNADQCTTRWYSVGSDTASVEFDKYGRCSQSDIDQVTPIFPAQYPKQWTAPTSEYRTPAKYGLSITGVSILAVSLVIPHCLRTVMTQILLAGLYGSASPGLFPGLIVLCLHVLAYLCNIFAIVSFLKSLSWSSRTGCVRQIILKHAKLSSDE
jgi:hypothetical protein